MRPISEAHYWAVITRRHMIFWWQTGEAYE